MQVPVDVFHKEARLQGIITDAFIGNAGADERASVGQHLGGAWVIQAGAGYGGRAGETVQLEYRPRDVGEVHDLKKHGESGEQLIFVPLQ